MSNQDARLLSEESLELLRNPLLRANSKSNIGKLFLKRPRQFLAKYTDDEGSYDLDRNLL